LNYHPVSAVNLYTADQQDREEAVSLIHSRTFAAAGVIAVLAIATQAQAGQADRRATNAKQRAQTSEPEGRTSRREETRPPAPAARPSQSPQANRSSSGASPRSSQPSQPSQPTVQTARNSRPSEQPAQTSRNSRPSQQSPQQQAPVVQSRGTVQGYAVRRPSPPPAPVRPEAHYVGPRDVRPVYVRPVVVAPRHVVIAPRGPSWGHFRRGYYAPLHVVRYYQPYYVFQPRVRFSFGLTIGHTVAYPVWYNPYPVYGYSIGPRYGGVSFDIDPSDAAIFIDDEYVGIADDFSPYDAPLTLRAGLHRVEIRARGMQPMDFDLTVVAGQVIPYRGTLAYQ
jgi:hypothetical protein